MRDAAMTLVDGRTLAYTDLGDSDGLVAMYFHGAPTSRLDLAAYEDSCAGRGIRVVSPDRPGYGRSSPQPRRSMRDCPADVAALADHLAVDRFIVVALPAMRLDDEDAARSWLEQHYGPDGSRFLTFTPRLAPGDAALLEDQAGAQTFFATVVESFGQGVGGLAVDLTVQGRPWPFDPGAVRAPTIVLHGEDDPYLPVAHGRHTAKVIRGARFTLMRGHAHVSLIREIPRLCTDLLALARGAAS